METVVHNIRDLSGRERSAAEQLVGHALGEDQQLVIQIVPAHPTATPVSAATVSAATVSERLSAWRHVYEGLTNAEIDEIDKSIVRCHGSRSLPKP